MRRCGAMLILLAAVVLVAGCGPGQGKGTAGAGPASQKAAAQAVATDTGAGNGWKPVSYRIIEEIYREKNDRRDVAIRYPQIAGLSDSERQQKINELLKREALQYVNLLSEDDSRLLVMPITSEITWRSENLLSVQYTGLVNVKGTPHPTHYFYTTNVDVARGVKVRLKDIVHIDEGWAAKFRDEKLKSVRLGEINGKLVFGNADRTPADTARLFTGADAVFPEVQNVFSCFTPEALVISGGIAHAAGDHAEFAIPYRDIADKIKFSNPVWRDFFPPGK